MHGFRCMCFKLRWSLYKLFLKCLKSEDSSDVPMLKAFISGVWVVAGTCNLVTDQGCGCFEFPLGFVRGPLCGLIGYSHFVMNRYMRTILVQTCPQIACVVCLSHGLIFGTQFPGITVFHRVNNYESMHNK